MNIAFLFFLLEVLVAALVGGFLAKWLKIQPLIGYMLAGVFARFVFSQADFSTVEKVAQIGLIFLLFSLGLELSLHKLSKVIKIAIGGGILQLVVCIFLFSGLLRIAGFDNATSWLLASGFALSSTAVVVKLLMDRGESDTIHGEIMVGWLLVQDLAVIPILIIITALGSHQVNFQIGLVLALAKAVLAVVVVLAVGKLLLSRVLHRVAALGSREILDLAAIVFVLGASLFTSFLGVSPILGAFLAGVAIAESQEHLAIFAELRPMRDFLVALFFVTLGFLAIPQVIFANFGIIILLTLAILVIKSVVIYLICLLFGYHGKTAFVAGIGLSQIGEFSFVIFSLAGLYNLISSTNSSIGIAVTILSLVFFPLFYRETPSFWQKFKTFILNYPRISKLLLGWDKKLYNETQTLENHIIICGYGRVGAWVGKALDNAQIRYIVVDFNQEVVKKLKKEGKEVIYGDPTLKEVLTAAGVEKAKVIVIAIPDHMEQETIITTVQTMAPDLKIISRAHFDSDVKELRALRVDKIVQPEFEASVAIVRSIFSSMGKPKEEVAERLKSLRLSRAMY